MARIEVRLNTQGMTFPLLSKQSGRSVINASGDLTYIPNVTADGDIPVDRGVPGAFYMENVLPTSQGWASVGYTTLVPVPVSPGTHEDIEMVHGATVDGGKPSGSNLRTYIAPVDDAGTKSLHYINSSGNWVQIGGTPTWTEAKTISVAFVNGYTYILVPGDNLYVFDIAANTLLVRTLTGITISEVEGVLAASGYLLIWTSKGAFWSSTVDLEDFTPSEVSGAGGGSIQELDGEIVYCLPTQLGFLVFSNANAVTAVYSGNSSFPFEFRRLAGTGGVSDKHQVATNPAGTFYYTYTTSGLQKLTQITAENAFTNISDFIDGSIFESYNTTSHTLSEIALTAPMARAIQVVSNRYVIISYNSVPSSTYTHALVVDVLQHRIGKLKIDHTRAFEYRDLLVGTNLDNQGKIAFLQSTGKIVVVDTNKDCTNATGVLILGKLQFSHSKMLQLQEVEIENTCESSNFELFVLPTLDGKNFSTPVQGYEIPEDAGTPLRRFNFSNVARSHSLLLQGGFELVTALASFNQHGRT